MKHPDENKVQAAREIAVTANDDLEVNAENLRRLAELGVDLATALSSVAQHLEAIDRRLTRLERRE